MIFYEDAPQLYGCLQGLFGRLEAEAPQAVEPLLKSRLLVRLHLSQPPAEVTIDARKRPLHIVYGPNGLRPELDVALTADTLHRILLGELSLTKALGRKDVKPRGPAWKTMAMADLFRQAQRLYPQVLREEGLA